MQQLETRTSLLKHSFISKKYQDAPGTSAAHLRYISRQSETQKIIAMGPIPADYWQAQDFLNEHEAAIRKDGHVIEKIMITFPIGMELAHAEEAVSAFGRNITLDGKASFYAGLQHFTHEKNRHVHCIFVDADDIGGKRVFYATKGRSATERFKDAWELHANSILAREGYDFRLDRKEYQRLKLEAERTVIAQLEARVPPDAPRQQLEPDEEDVQHSGEEIVMPKTPQEVRDRVQHALSYQRELDEVRMRLQNAYTLETNMRQVQDSVERARDELVRRRDYAAAREKQAARAVDELAEHTKANGNLKGFRVPLLGWKSPARHDAEQAQREAHEARELESQALIQLENHKDYLQREERDAAELESQFRQINGTQQDMRLAEQVFEKEADRELNGWEEDQDGTIVKHQALEPQEVWALVETMDISEDEARELFKQMGATEYLLMLDRGQEIE